MTKHEQTEHGRTGKLAGMPFDWRRPTSDRFRAELWNPKDVRMFTPKAVGWGYGINFYWLAHPAGYVRARRGA